MSMYKNDLPNLQFFLECVGNDGQVPPDEYDRFKDEGELEDLESDWNMVHSSDAQLGDSETDFQNVTETYALEEDMGLEDSAPIEIDWGISIENVTAAEARDDVDAGPSAVINDGEDNPIEIDWGADVKVWYHSLSLSLGLAQKCLSIKFVLRKFAR